MNLKKDLEIILITYNRQKYLQKTLKQIFADDSPVKDLDITILDNKSTDGTSKLIQEYVKKFPNIKHIIHNRNISGNGNIARAYEIASKKYLWILCDDDEFDWTYWNEIEEGLEKDYDVVMTERNSQSSNLSIPVIVNELTFVPAGIYKTENITDDVMQNIMANIVNSFPQLMLVCHIVNNNKKIYIPEHTIITQNFNKGISHGFTRGFKQDIHYRLTNLHWFVGYINSYQMIKDKKLRHQCCEVLWIGKSFAFSMSVFLKENGLYSYNICDIFNGISFKQKIIFLAVLFKYILIRPVLHFITHNILYIKIDDEKINFKILGILKTHIRYDFFKRYILNVIVEEERIRLIILGKLKTNICLKPKLYS